MKDRLIKEALKVSGKLTLNSHKNNHIGSVSSALITKKGNIYTGISIHMVCGLGFCAEASAIAEMVKNKETEISLIVAVKDTGEIIPPCGRCRELMYQLDKNNLETDIVIDNESVMKLKDLLPKVWIN